VAETEGGVAGALAWRRLGDSLHVIALATDPMWQRAGIGSYLLAEAELIARRLKIPRIVVTLSNDNIPAQYFYQRRGYRMTRVLSGAISAHPRNRGLVGFANIPIVDELQLSKDLQP
jgi:ribosomal protein S18 acetylase RimI-like enzyme